MAHVELPPEYLPSYYDPNPQQEESPPPTIRPRALSVGVLVCAFLLFSPLWWLGAVAFVYTTDAHASHSLRVSAQIFAIYLVVEGLWRRIL